MPGRTRELVPMLTYRLTSVLYGVRIYVCKPTNIVTGTTYTPDLPSGACTGIDRTGLTNLTAMRSDENTCGAHMVSAKEESCTHLCWIVICVPCATQPHWCKGEALTVALPCYTIRRHSPLRPIGHGVQQSALP